MLGKYIMLGCCSTLVVLFWCFAFWCKNVLLFSDIERYDCATGYLGSRKTNYLAIQQWFSELDDWSQKNLHKIQLRYELLRQLWYWLKLWRYLFISVFLCVCFHCLRLFCGSICQIKIPGVAGFARSTTNQILMSNLELQLLCSKLGSDRDKWFWNIFDKLQYYWKIVQYNMHLTFFSKNLMSNLEL